MNISVVSKDDKGNKTYSYCSSYGDKGNIHKALKKSDFVKLFGKERKSIDENGKEYSNVIILSFKLLKAKG